MQASRGRKSFMTLIELMIVMFLITIIAGVVSYKVKDSMDYGKAFKTHQGMQQVKTILEMAVTKKTSKMSEIEANWENYVRRSPLAGNAQALIIDGWGEKYSDVSIKKEGNRLIIKLHSESYKEYLETHSVLFEDN